MGYLFTSESVSEGHPDKVADQISDAVLDKLLAYDDQSHVACETLVTTGQVVIAGEISSDAYIDIPLVARETIRRIGYTKSEYCFDAESCGVLNAVHEQSPDINRGVAREVKEEQGAGDQGMMFGYASSETENLMPLPIVMAHKIVRTGALLRKNGTLKHARPDMKAQVTIDYTDEKNPRVDTIVCSCQHDEEVDIEDFRKELLEVVIKPVVSSFNMNLDFKYYINPTGRFVIGGPLGDTGVTGRKIIVDTYGGSCPHGGGAFSGKDPSKVDRSAAYAARHCAKNIVGASLASRCQVQVSYAIGVSAPVSIAIETFGTETVEKSKILEAVEALFDFTPKGIIERFSLTNPTFKYRELTNYGHFGRPDLNLPFEKLDMVDRLKEYIEKIK